MKADVHLIKGDHFQSAIQISSIVDKYNVPRPTHVYRNILSSYISAVAFSLPVLDNIKILSIMNSLFHDGYFSSCIFVIIL